MKKTTTGALLLAGVFLFGSGPTWCDTFTFTPDPADISNLDHYQYFEWGIDVSALAGMKIIDMELRIADITNWDDGENILYIHVLDNAPLGLTKHFDNQRGGDAFAGLGALIDEWSDTNGPGVTDDLNYLFSTEGVLTEAWGFCADGVLAIGFDPDCHFWNCGVELVVTAEEPLSTHETSWGEVKSLFR